MWCNGGANGIKENLNSLIDKELRLVLSDPGEALYLIFKHLIIKHFSLRQNRLFPICTPSDFNVLRHTG